MKNSCLGCVRHKTAAMTLGEALLQKEQISKNKDSKHVLTKLDS